MVLITSYNREHLLKELLSDIERQKPDEKVVIVDDGSPVPYDLSEFNLQIEYIRFDYNHGKSRYWELVAFAFKFLKGKDFKYCWMLPDDVRLNDNFFTDSLRTWNEIQSDRKIVLSTGHTHGRHLHPNWTRTKPEIIGNVVLTNWCDMCFMCERKFFEVLKWDIEKYMWNWNENSGSGVGAWISRKLYREKWEQCHVLNSLVYFQNVPSQMFRNVEKKVL